MKNQFLVLLNLCVLSVVLQKSNNKNFIHDHGREKLKCVVLNAGTLAPPLNGIRGFDSNGQPIYMPPWLSDWLNLNVMVPTIAFIVIIVGILVICIAVTRRRGDMRNGPKDVYCRCFHYMDSKSIYHISTINRLTQFLWWCI